MNGINIRPSAHVDQTARDVEAAEAVFQKETFRLRTLEALKDSMLSGSEFQRQNRRGRNDEICSPGYSDHNVYVLFYNYPFIYRSISKLSRFLEYSPEAVIWRADSDFRSQGSS